MALDDRPYLHHTHAKTTDRQTSRLGTEPDTLTDTSEAHDGDLSMFHGHNSAYGRLY